MRAFFAAHRDEIVGLARHRAEHERAEHPLERFMDVEDAAGGVLIKTTDTHLARDIGEAVHAAYKGSLEYHCNNQEKLLRVQWRR